MPEVIPFPKPEKRMRLSRTGWKRLRDDVAKGRPCCAISCMNGATDAHHVYGRDLGGDDVRENLAPLCHDCHMRYEDRAPGWRLVAGGVRRYVGHVHLLYLIKKLGGTDQARSFLDRYYPEIDHREGGPDAA